MRNTRSAVPWSAFSSASRRQDVFGRRNTRFNIRALHGKDIRSLSDYPGEDEVLFKAGSRFRVLITWGERGKAYIELKEVDD